MINKDLYLRLYHLLRPHKRSLVIAMFSMVMVSIFGSAQAFIIKPLIDKIFIDKDALMLNLLPIALVSVFILKGIFYYTYTSVLDITGQLIIKDLREAIFKHIHSLPIAFFHKMPTGELMSRVVNDATLIQTAVSRALVGVLKDVVQVVGLLVVIFYMNWQLALMSIIFLPLAFIPVVHFGKKFRKLSITNQQTVAQISNLLHETITGQRIVKAFGMEKHEQGRFRNVIDKLFGVIVKDIKINSLQHPLMEGLGGVGIAAVIWYGGHQVLVGESTPGTFIAFLASLIMIYEPIKGISNINSPVQQGIAAATRVFDLLDTKPAITNKPGANELPPFKDYIKLNNISFSYDGAVDVLKNINLNIKAGEVVALVGSSGGGKTTMANLVPRFYDVTKGQILVDGFDIKDVTFQSLRRQIGVVTQQTILFNDTVTNNIAYGEPNRPVDEVKAAAKAAYALDFINELPDGFNTVIGESGCRLSGGQQQRISIARAILKNAPILILDEATSALDTESEREVQKALENLMKNRTTLVIAHRLSTIRNANRIIVIQDGQIKEEGDHDSLINKKGVYEMLHSMQHH